MRILRVLKFLYKAPGIGILSLNMSVIANCAAVNWCNIAKKEMPQAAFSRMQLFSQRINTKADSSNGFYCIRQLKNLANNHSSGDFPVEVQCVELQYIVQVAFACHLWTLRKAPLPSDIIALPSDSKLTQDDLNMDGYPLVEVCMRAYSKLSALGGCSAGMEFHAICLRDGIGGPKDKDKSCILFQTIGYHNPDYPQLNRLVPQFIQEHESERTAGPTSPEFWRMYGRAFDPLFPFSD
jgi:hypothetical protein